MKTRNSNNRSRFIIIVLIPLIFLAFPGCKSLSPIFVEVDNAPIKFNRPHVFTVFMDGTNNTVNYKKQNKHSNVKRMYDLKKAEYSSLYVEGVGANFKGGGIFFGLGTRARVIKAYTYLTERYTSSQDSIFLIGFSRGAYSCRILSNLIYTAGILDLKKFTGKKGKKIKKKLIKGLYKAYTSETAISQRKLAVATYLREWNTKLNPNDRFPIDTSSSIKIELMALYDTVEALGKYDHEENFESPNKSHFNQLANIKKTYHALSLDDNRALLYTPLLLTTQEVRASLSWGNNSTRTLKDAVEEVWFSGAHSDVGGSLPENPMVSYTSLKWMLARLEKHKLFKNTEIEVDEFGTIRNMHKLAFKLGIAHVNRNIPEYYEKTVGVNNKPINIHESVIHRLEKGIVPEWKVVSTRKAKRRNSWAKFPLAKDSKWETKDWFQKPPFNNCFIVKTKNGIDKYFLKENCDYIKVIFTDSVQ